MLTTTRPVAAMILDQLGGNRFAAMFGVKLFVTGPDYLQFDIGRGAKNRATKIRVTLNARDLYDVVFWRFDRKTFGLVEVGSQSDVFSGNLGSILENATGFYANL